MKTTIKIKGQIGGNYKLRAAISGLSMIGDVEEGMYSNFYLHFQTKKDAIKALSEGRKSMIQDGYDISYSRGHLMSYDASTAVILPTKKAYN